MESLDILDSLEFLVTQVSAASVAIVVSPGLAGFQDLAASPVILASLVSQDTADLAGIVDSREYQVIQASLDLVVSQDSLE